MSEEKTVETTTPPADTTPAASPPAPASAEAAQAALAASDKKPTLITEKGEPLETPPVYSKDKLTMPEGFEVAPERIESFSKIVEGLPHDKAQALVNLYADFQKQENQKSFDFWKETREKWETEARGWEDPEVKNAKFTAGDRTISGLDAMVHTIKKVIDNPQLTDPKFKEALEFTGMGSNPATIRTLYRWASKLVEGGPTAVGGVSPSVGARDAEAARSAAKTLYPDLPSVSNQ